MRHFISTCALALLLAAPAYAQNAAPQAEASRPAAQGMMMNCPMMSDANGMRKDMGDIMSDLQAMMKDTKDPAMKRRMQKMHTRMRGIMVSMKNMGGMELMGNGIMGGQTPGSAAPAKPQAAPSSAPVSTEDHAAHHPEK